MMLVKKQGGAYEGLKRRQASQASKGGKVAR